MDRKGGTRIRIKFCSALKKSVSTVMVTLLLFTTLTFKVDVQPAKAKPASLTVPDDYLTIQEAIDAANPGDIIYVRGGIYYEHLVVDKPLVLVGESKETTIVDGMGENRTVVEVTASNVVVTGFTVRNSSRIAGTSHAGIEVSGNACNITGNIVAENKMGIFATSQKSRITENVVKNNGQGIALHSSSEVTVEANNVSANTVGISLASSPNNIVVDNRAVNSSEGGHGMILSANSFNNTIRSNQFLNNYHGMWFSTSPNNSIFENTIANNKLLGIELADSSDNIFYNNNFINNGIPPLAPTIKHITIDTKSTNTWDNGYPSGGNYWSNYTGTDANHDGIDDVWYTINADNMDCHPLMGMFSSFNTSLGYHVTVISNSTIEDFEYFESNSTIRMHISNTTTSQTYGFGRIRIPHALMSEPYNVIINGVTPIYWNYTLYDDGENRWIYFSYQHSTLEIIIIPEFPSLGILPLLVIASLLVALAHIKKKAV